MTDRSNYGPVRRLSPSVSTDNRKPYSRTGLKGVLGTVDLNSGDTTVPTPPDSSSPYYPYHVETPQLEAPTQTRTRVPDNGPRNVAGFPTYEQYQRIEEEYLTSLSERKQPKALISQALFDKIFAVLQNGSEDRASTAQFRFWVRKMFVLAYPQTSFSHNAGQTSELEPVVLHDKRPVAIKEQLYEVLCYCHAVARHGGRDKTCATLRLHYSWVPKELTAKFVKACPTCTLKRSGNPDLLSRFGQTVSSSPYAPQPTVTVPAEPTSGSLFPGGPNDSPPDLSFVVGSKGCDDVGSGGTRFGPSIFATPDLSVYPSPTLSAGSLGPTTPSPYLSSGLFGYPAVFDPGHGSLSSVPGWDTSSFSPCSQMYADELHTDISKQQEAPVSTEEIIDATCTQGMQLHLPRSEVVRPLCTRALSSGGGGDDDGYNADPYPVDMNDVDPVLLMEDGYPPFTLVGSTRTLVDDTEADLDPGTGGPGLGGDDGGSYLQVLNLAARSSASPSPSSNSDSRNFHQQQQPRPPPQFVLGFSRTTTPAMSSGGAGHSHNRMQEQQASSAPGPRQQRPTLTHEGPPVVTTTTRTAPDSSTFNRDIPESFLSLPPRGDNLMMDMLMSRFVPPLPPLAPTPMHATAAALGRGMGIEVEVPTGGNMLLPRGCGLGRDTSDNDSAQEEEELELEHVDEEADRHRNRALVEDAVVGARWNSPEAWLAQSDSVQWCE